MNLKEFYEASGYQPDEVDFLLRNEPFSGLGVALFDLSKSHDEPLAWWCKSVIVFPGDEVMYPTLFQSPVRAQKRANILNKDEFSDVLWFGNRNNVNKQYYSPAIWLAPDNEWNEVPLIRYADFSKRKRFPGSATQ